MRLWIPSPPSLRMQFSNRFQNLSYVLGGGGMPVGAVSVDRGADLSGGGYIVFGARGADSVWQLREWTIDVDVLVPAVGTQRAILTCGHPALGTSFELGIAATGEMYATGTATVTSDSTVTPGRHTLRYVYTGTAIEFHVDGVRLSLTAFSPANVSAPRLVLGMAADGASRPLASTVYKVDVYREALEFWSIPRNLPDAYWIDPVGAPSTLTYAVQPTLANGTFLNTSGLTAFSATLSVEEYLGRQCLKVTAAGSPFAAFWASPGVITGNRLAYAGYMAGDGDGSGASPRATSAVTAFAIGTDSDVAWHYVDESATNLGTDGKIYLAANGASGSIARFAAGYTIRNLSLASVAPRQGVGDLVQATATAQPWVDSTTGGIRFDGVGDYLVSSLAASDWKFLHDGTGCKVAIVATYHSVTTYGYLLGSFSASADSGLALGTDVSIPSALRVIVANGSGGGIYGLDEKSAIGTVVLNTKMLIVLESINGANLVVRKDGATVIDAAVSSFSSADPAFTLHVGSIGGGGQANATIHEVVIGDYSVSTADLERYLAAKHGITLP